MSLPILTTPTFTLIIPSTKKQIKYRPFLVKEEKVLLLVKESKDQEVIANAMKDVIKSCTFNKIDPSKLATFDIEYIFLQIRAKSIGESIELMMRCKNKVHRPADDTLYSCDNLIEFVINVDDIKVEIPKDHTKVFMLENDIGMTFKYPSIDTISSMKDNDNDYSVIIELIENIFDKNNVYDIKDVSKDKLEEFVDSLSSKQFKDIRDKFFLSMPTLKHEAKYKCSKCGYEGNHVFEGLTDFF